MNTSAPRRPKWVTWNKVLLALHYMADEAGIIVSEPAEIARHARLGWRAIESALQVLESKGHLYVENDCVLPWTIILDLTTSQEEPLSWDEVPVTSGVEVVEDRHAGSVSAAVGPLVPSPQPATDRRPCESVRPDEAIVLEPIRSSRQQPASPEQLVFAWCDHA